MRKIKSIAIAATLLIISAVCGLAYTNAKYTSQVTGEVTASVAKYVFDVSASDSYSSTDTLRNLTLAETCDETTLIDKKIAPGTSGSFDIVINTEQAEVGVHYDITFARNTTKGTNSALPSNLKLTLDGNEWHFEDGISGDIYANAENQTVTHTVAWEWIFETKDASNSSVAGDALDTADGRNSFDYSFDVTAVGTQIRPVSR